MIRAFSLDPWGCLKRLIKIEPNRLLLKVIALGLPMHTHAHTYFLSCELKDRDRFVLSDGQYHAKSKTEINQGKWKRSHVLLRDAISCFQRLEDGYKQTLGPRSTDHHPATDSRR